MNILVGQINLLRYVDASTIEVDGVRGVFIPTIQNPSLFEGKTGVWANITAVPTPNDKYGNTHFIAASVKKEVLDSYPDADKKVVTPIVGNFKTLGEDKKIITNTSSTASPVPQFGINGAPSAKVDNFLRELESMEEDNDLPL